MPSQPPVLLKVAAAIGVGVPGSSGTVYGLTGAPAAPTAAPVTTKVAAATTPASRHPVNRTFLLDTGSSLGTPNPLSLFYRKRQIETFIWRIP